MHLFLVLLRHSTPSISSSFCFWFSLSLCLLCLSESVFLCLLPWDLIVSVSMPSSVADCLSHALGSGCLCVFVCRCLSVCLLPGDLAVSVSVSSSVAVCLLPGDLAVSVSVSSSVAVCLSLARGCGCLVSVSSSVALCLSVSCLWDLAVSVSAAIFLSRILG